MQRKERAEPSLDIGWLCDQLIKLNRELCGLPSQMPCSDIPWRKKLKVYLRVKPLGSVLKHAMDSEPPNPNPVLEFERMIEDFK